MCLAQEHNAEERLELTAPRSRVKDSTTEPLRSRVLCWLEKSNFAEFKVHLIHKKQVPLIHNTVLILCDEGAGLVDVYKTIHSVLRGDSSDHLKYTYSQPSL